MHIRVSGLGAGSLLLGLALLGCDVTSGSDHNLAVPVGSKESVTKAADPTFRIVERVAHGRLEDHHGLQVLRLWGTPTERGFAHAQLLGRDIAEMGHRELAARFAGKKDLLQRARAAFPLVVKFPKDVSEEMRALLSGIQQLGIDLRMPTFGRDLDLLDLEMINAMDILMLMGCSGVTLWDEQVEGGGVLTGRNFDLRLTGAYMVDRCILLVQHPHEGKAFASVGWPGYVGVVTGINEDGVAIFLHVGNSEADAMPLPGCMPTAMAARETLRDSDVSDAYEAASEFLRETSSPRGYLTRVVLPTSAVGQPARVFEADRYRVSWRQPASHCVVTNHFLSRKGERRVSKDSRLRRQGLLAEVGKTLKDGGKATVADMWSYLGSVDRGKAAARRYSRPKGTARRGGTLHSLVFRNDPWVFELGIGEFDASEGLTAATRSSRRYRLTREQVFAHPN